MPDLPPEAIRAAALVLCATEGQPEPEDLALADDVLRAAAPHIAAQAIAEYKAAPDAYAQGLTDGAAAERERIWNRPVTQRLELRGGYPGGVWQCAGCEAQLTESGIIHAPRCSEMRLADLLEPAPEVTS